MGTELKKLYVIGDSVSMQYGPYLERFLNGTLLYDRKGKGKVPGDLDYESAVNGGDSRNVLEYLQAVQPEYDVLLLNCGLHDIKTTTAGRQVTEGDYRRNLERIVRWNRERNRNVVWVNSTPVNDERHNARNTRFRRYNADLLLYNRIAAKVMRAAGIPIIDLYTFTTEMGENLYRDHVHFTDPVAKLQAAFIAGHLIAKCLWHKENSTL